MQDFLMQEFRNLFLTADCAAVNLNLRSIVEPIGVLQELDEIVIDQVQLP